MKKKVLVCLCCFALWSNNVFAGNFFKDAAQIILGVGTSISAHDLGHHLIGNSTGASGFIFQGVGSEILMATTKRDNRFSIGYVGFNILSNIGYVVKTELGIGTGTGSDGYYTDNFMNFQNETQRRLAEAAVLVHAGWLTYRLFTDKDFKTWIGLEVNNGTPLIKVAHRF